MRFETPLVEGTFVRRYKRFFVDAVLADGRSVVAHCPNTGSLTGCLVEGAPVLLQPADNPKRKLRWTWKMIRLGRNWVGVDTGIANGLVREAIEAGRIPELSGYTQTRTEVRYGVEGRSRIDLLLTREREAGEAAVHRPSPALEAAPEAPSQELVYVEVKNTTLAFDRGDQRVAAFPDAVTQRGTKHLGELSAMVAQGHRAAMVYCVQRSDCTHFTPADEVDPTYGQALRKAVECGVEVYALATSIGPRSVILQRPLQIVLD